VRFEKVPEKELSEILFLRSFIKNTSEIQYRIMDNKRKHLNYRYIASLNKMLTKLNLFVFGQEDQSAEGTQNLAAAIQQLDLEPIPQRQMILRDYGILDTLIKICFLPLRLHNIALTTRTQTMVTLKQTMSLTYDCIRHSIAEYRPNELYASQWLGLMIEDTFKNNSNVLLKAEQTLKELIDNNERILNKRINKDTIHKFLLFLARVAISSPRIPTANTLNCSMLSSYAMDSLFFTTRGDSPTS
jgi:hypothetical protein